mmetsp:Transcript_55809/g.125879  ORF Transcript_55809/g.125879 Transcript_55809/m.125879 type:complete len:776 (-) Transcript_55809:232-2559(-)
MALKVGRMMRYREMYSRLRSKPGELRSSLDSSNSRAEGRSPRKIRRRCAVLFLMFFPVVAWRLIGSYSYSPEASVDDVFGSEPPARLLNGTAQAGMAWGYSCLSADDKYDKNNVGLHFVRESDVTMGGQTTSYCNSGSGPCLKQGREWTLIYYIPGMFYMFVALAIVCDEFFVPALEMFVEHYGISMDVAGATFMAAGGSMPELFTSLIAVFDETDVGFAAIVGSAVFNVLFVIAVCALASEEPLVLTAWPLARDCFFYIVGLMLVAIFFQGVTPNQIEWWEALVLFIWYLCYCSFMKFNERFKNWVESKRRKRAVSPEPDKKVDSDITVEDLAGGRGPRVSMRMPSTFRGGIVKLLTQHASMTETAGIAMVTELKGELRETFKSLDTDGDDHINESEFSVFMHKLGWQGPGGEDSDVAEENIKKLWKRMPLTEDDKLGFEEFRRWYTVSETRVKIEVRCIFDKLDVNGDGHIDSEEISVLLKSLGHTPTESDINDVMLDMYKAGLCEDSGDTSSDDCKLQTGAPQEPPPGTKLQVRFSQFEKWYTTSLFADQHHKVHELQAELDEGFTLDWPENPTCMQLFLYFFTYPLCVAMYCTLPDVRRTGFEGKIHWAIIEFVLSLVWIAVFSFALYEFTIVSSNTIGIPTPVAAVTILAAGTSVPDLISSYVVARQGQGDMAVSSSIGSNIFDITVGLPIPWMLYSAIKGGRAIKVSASNLGISVMVLMVMLGSVIITVMLMKWRMTKGMGAIMFVLYFVFIAQDLLQQFPDGNPVINI